MSQQLKNVSDITAFKSVKKAKVHKNNLETILQIVNLAVRGLSLFEIYQPVYIIIGTLKEQRTILKSQLNKCNEIINSKENK